MKTELNKVAAFIATAIWADGEYDEAERITVSEIADALGFKENDFSAAIDKCIDEIKPMDEEAINKYLIDNAVDIDEEDANIIFEAALEMVLVDGVLSPDEVSNLLSMAEAIGIEPEQAVLMLADMVKDEPDLKVELK